jgi:hypothetical protein
VRQSVLLEQLVEEIREFGVIDEKWNGGKVSGLHYPLARREKMEKRRKKKVGGRNRGYLVLIIPLAILLMWPGISFTQSSTNYRIRIDVLSGGGGPEGSTSYDLDSVLGQSSAIGFSSSAHYINHAGFWSAIPEVEPYVPIYVAKTGGCGGKAPCYEVLQTAINSSESFSVINVTEETYAENIVFNSPKFLSLRGGWDLTFTNSSSYTVIQGSMTISKGKLIVEYIILR